MCCRCSGLPSPPPSATFSIMPELNCSLMIESYSFSTSDFRKKVVRNPGVFPVFRPSPPPPPCFYSVPPCPPCFCLLSSSKNSEKCGVAAWGQRQDLLLMLTCLTAPHFYHLVPPPASAPCLCPRAATPYPLLMRLPPSCPPPLLPLTSCF